MPFVLGIHTKYIQDPLKHALSPCADLEQVFNFIKNLLNALWSTSLSLYFRGEVSAVVNQVTMKMKIKQMIQNSPPPELLGKCFT